MQPVIESHPPILELILEVRVGDARHERFGDVLGFAR
jgi:hypothetical protein